MFTKLKSDFPAGFAVFLVAIPLCLGIAVASGAPLLSGLLAGIVGGIVVGLLSDSPLSVSGPAAGLVAIVVSSIDKLGFEHFLVALIIAGLIQIVLGITKASKVAEYIPHTVIKGMLAAIGMTLIIKQLPVMLGIDIHNFHWNIGDISFNAFIVGMLSLGVMLSWNRWVPSNRKVIPGSLLAVIVGVMVSLIYYFMMPDWTLTSSQLVQLPTNFTNIDSIWTSLSHPAFSDFGNIQIYITAITLALVASIETILSIHAIDKMDPQNRTTSLNREMIAQGVGNMTSGFLGGLPVTSVIVRSSVNLSAGAKSKYSAIIHGILMVLAILFAAKYMNMIPMAVLAAVLVLTGYGLSNPERFISKYKSGWLSFIPYITTFIVILAEDLLVGVCAGIIVHYAMLYIQKRWFPHLISSEADIG